MQYTAYWFQIQWPEKISHFPLFCYCLWETFSGHWIWNWCNETALYFSGSDVCRKTTSLTVLVVLYNTAKKPNHHHPILVSWVECQFDWTEVSRSNDPRFYFVFIPLGLLKVRPAKSVSELFSRKKQNHCLFPLSHFQFDKRYFCLLLCFLLRLKAFSVLSPL